MAKDPFSNRESVGGASLAERLDDSDNAPLSSSYIRLSLQIIFKGTASQ